jgi:CubicO group peptidase (beta-lactamase class C family)
MLQTIGGVRSGDRRDCARPHWRSPAGPTAGARPRWIRLLVAGLGCVLAAACTSPDRQEATATSQAATATSQASAAPIPRDYWPTAGWRTAAPAEQGVDPAVLDDLDAIVPAGYPSVRSVLVVRHGYLVVERYWHGVKAGDGHDVRSVTKSFVSALVGIALGDGKLKGLDQTVEELLADHLPATADPRLRQVTVEQLLTMTSGLAGDDASLGGDDQIFDRMAQSPDWVRHILSRRLDRAPGEDAAYSSASSHLLSVIVADAAGQSTLAFARAKLFGPLGIATENALELTIRHWPPTPAELAAYEQASVAWPRDPQGYHFGGAFLKLPARDLAKFGYLYLNGGRWDGTQVVPADYVAASTRPQSEPGGPGDYGYQWWVTNETGPGSFRAQGYGGQLIQVIPNLDLVVVVTSDVNQESRDPSKLVRAVIVPAVTG